MSETRETTVNELTRIARTLHRFLLWQQRSSPVLLVVSGFAAILLAAISREVEILEPESLLHRVYLGVQALAFNWTTDSGAVNSAAAGPSLLLWAAMISALAFGTVGALELTGRLFDTALQRIWISIAYHDHVVVCGLDSAGASLCEALVQSGCPVVAVHPDAQSPRVSRARRLGVLVHIGDPLDPAALEAANVDRAAWVAAFDRGGAIASVARQTLGGRSSPLRYLMARSSQTAEPQPMLVSDHRHSTALFHAIRVNLHDRAASFLIGDVNPFRPVLEHARLDELAKAQVEPARVLVAGNGEMCERIAGQLAWDAAVVFTPVAGRPTLKLALAHPRAETVLAGLKAGLATRVSTPDEIPELEQHPLDRPIDASVLTDDRLFTGAGGDLRAAFDHVFVCCASNEQTLTMAEAVARRFTQHRLPFHPIVVAVFEEFEDGESVPPALQKLRFDARALPDPRETQDAPRAQKLLYVHDCWRRTLTAERLLMGSPEWREPWDGERLDRMAARAHLVYENGRNGTERPMSEAWAEWKNVPAELKESDRQFVRDIDRKLAMVGRRRARVDSGHPRAPLTEVEVECLARAEHERWLVERWERGWSQDVTRDAARKLSTNLEPWHALDGSTQDIDRWMIRGIEPGILGPAGFLVTWA